MNPHRLDGAFVATVLETAAVAVLHMAWRSITEGVSYRGPPYRCRSHSPAQTLGKTVIHIITADDLRHSPSVSALAFLYNNLSSRLQSTRAALPLRGVDSEARLFSSALKDSPEGHLEHLVDHRYPFVSIPSSSVYVLSVC